MKCREMIAAALGLALSGTALAQAAGEAPKPTAEHQKLGYFVGKWTTEGDMKPSPFAPPTSYTFKWEMLGEDGSWKPILEGKSTKAP